MMGIRMVWVTALLPLVVGSSAVAQTHVGELVEVPLRVHGGRLLVPVEAPDGSALEFALSTGTPTVLSESTAARFGDHTGLTMGGVPVETEGGHTIPDGDLTIDGRVIDGIIGPNTLNQFDMLVDVPGGRLVLKPIGSSVTWAGMVMSDPVRVRVYHGMLLAFGVEFNGREYEAMLDLGMETLAVNEPVKAAMQIDAGDDVTLSLGATSLYDLPVRVLDLAIFSGWDPDGKGFVIVGAPVAYDCAISVSWVHREIRTCVR
jgi:hypothetical protein